MRISDWSSDVCSSDLEEVKRSGGDVDRHFHPAGEEHRLFARPIRTQNLVLRQRPDKLAPVARAQKREHRRRTEAACKPGTHCSPDEPFIKEAISRDRRSEVHKYELQSLLRTSYDVFCLKSK